MIDRKIGLTEGFLIACIPAIGYWFAFLYALGYCEFFDIPRMFIEIDALHIFVAAAGAGPILFFVLFIADSIFFIFRDLPKPLKLSFSAFGSPLILSIGIAIIFKWSLPLILASSFIMLTIFFIEFVSPLITQRNIKGYLAKLEKQREMEFEAKTWESVLDEFKKKIGSKWSGVITIMIIASFFAFFVGNIRARTETDFIVLSSDPELVVLKNNRNFLLAANFDRSSKTVSADYKIISINENMGQFNYERVGPLSPKGL